MRVSTALALLVASVTLGAGSGCGAGSQPDAREGASRSPREPRPGSADADAHGNGGGAGATAAASRALGANASFGELVAAARRLDDRQEADAAAGCILRGEPGGPWRLEADLAAAVRPLPDAPPELDPRLADADHRVRVLSRWGQLGAEARTMALVAFTSTPPLRAEGAAALFLTDRGVYLRRVGSAELEPTGPVPLAEAQPLAEALDAARLPLFVTAEANVPLTQLRALLALVPASLAGSTALAVPLAPDTRLPEPSQRVADTSALCPDGLPPPGEDRQEGTLRAEQITGALDPLRDGARRCFANSSGAAALGGRLALAMRIGVEGTVEAACFTADEIGDRGLRACVLEAARASRFPAPAPRGFVDAVVPLAFEPDTSLRQVPLCR